MTAHLALTLALTDALDRGQWIHCSSSDAWTSDEADPDEREVAADLCRSCPVVTECAAAGESESWGIWAGEWKGPAPRSTGRARKKAS